MDAAGTTLCAAGTMDDYAALVDRTTGEARLFPLRLLAPRRGEPPRGEGFTRRIRTERKRQAFRLSMSGCRI